MSDSAPVISYAAELRRKALHLWALLGPAAILTFGEFVSLLLAIPLAVVAVTCDWARVRVPWVRDVLHRLFGGLMRPEEVPPLGGPVVLNGATWMCVAGVACLLLFPAAVAAAAMAMQMVGDGAAAVIGRRYGRLRVWGTEKSVEGAAAFVVSAFAIGLAVVAWPGAGMTVAASAAGALAGALAEAVPLRVNDNLRVPLAAGTAMWAVLSL